jgi:hypothetical protein
VTSALEELENNRHSMVVPVVERGLARLTGAYGSEAEEVELVKDYARSAEGKRVHGYARKKGGTCARGREGASVEAIDGDGRGEEEVGGKFVVEWRDAAFFLYSQVIKTFPGAGVPNLPVGETGE